MNIRPVLLYACILFTLYSCQYDKADLKYPPQGPCDTTNMKYSVNVVPILSAYCYSCHSGNAISGGGIKLDSYSKVLIQVNNTLLLNAIQHTGGASPMPQGGGKLSDCNISIIKAWIQRGAPNN